MRSPHCLLNVLGVLSPRTLRTGRGLDVRAARFLMHQAQDLIDIDPRTSALALLSSEPPVRR